MQHRQPAGRLNDRIGRRFGKAQVDNLDLVAAFLVEADRRAYQRRDLIELFLAARLVGHVAFVVLGVGAVDQDGDRKTIEPAALDHLRLGGLGYLVIDDLLGFAALIGWTGIGAGGRALIGAGQFVADRHLVVVALACSRGFLPALAGPHDAAVGIEFVRGLGDAVEIEIGGGLHARMTRSDYRGDDRLHLFAQMLFVGSLPLIGLGATAVRVVTGAVRQQLALLIDDRDALRPQDGARGGDA